MKGLPHYWQSINVISLLLSPLSALFCLLVSIRRYLYRHGFFKTFTADIPVIVVGNIYIGGNGKTPLVIWLAEQLKQHGYKPAIVSRGYGAASKKKCPEPWPRMVSMAKNLHWFGDEPVLIHQATKCPVVIDPIRSRAIKKVQTETDCNIIISDDGLQHYAMNRLIEINITDARRLYGNGLCLPAGPLRESQQRLKSVDFIIYNISQASDIFHADDNAQAHKLFTMDYRFDELKALQTGSKQDASVTLSNFKGKIVHAVAGIGEPGNFFRLLRNNGLQVIEHAFADHYEYRAEDLRFDSQHPILMTEKDAVKCRQFPLTDAWYLPIKAAVQPQLIEQIISRLECVAAK
jgi:tetraacyldisaccharide 4'-kinase